MDSIHSHLRPCKLQRRRGNFFDDTEKTWDSDAADFRSSRYPLENRSYDPSLKSRTFHDFERIDVILFPDLETERV